MTAIYPGYANAHYTYDFATPSPPPYAYDSSTGGGTKSFSYDAIGSQTQILTNSETVDCLYDDAKRLTAIESDGDARTDFANDGRSFLRSSEPSQQITIFEDGFNSGTAACWSSTVGGASGGACPSTTTTEPTYSSEGLLMALRDDGGASDRHVLYFAGRPVGVLIDGLASVHFISTDHLGTPIIASTGAGTSAWDGGFEPFGADFSRAQASGVFLRFPGQWDDGSWDGQDVYYNVHRWYQGDLGRYTRADPLISTALLATSYRYTFSNPMRNVDPVGLRAVPPFSAPATIPGISPAPAPAPTCQPSPLAGLGRLAGPAFTIAFNELFNPTPLGDPKELPDSSCNPKCGNCDPTEHRFLQNAVVDSCKRPRACKPGMSPKELEENYWRNMQCYYSRREINERCFNGGDSGHRRAVSEAGNAARNCLDLITDPG